MTAPLCEPRNSPIEGRGLFALRDIGAGGRVVEYKGERISKAESARRCAAREKAAGGDGRVFVFTLDGTLDLDGDVPGNPAKFANHACDENCEVVLENGRLWLRALRDIVAGEELTFDYGFALAGYFERPCHCGSPNCAKFIVAKTERPRLLRERGRRGAGLPRA
jgi:SET domain-containing protein